MARIREDASEISLDPDNWDEMRRLAHGMVDDAIARLQGLRDGPVWQPMPAATRQGFEGPPPAKGTPLDAVYADVTGTLYPYAMGNIHPRFWGWYMGAGCLTGALADFLAGVDGTNLGGGDTGAAQVDLQVTDWLRQMMGFPEGASGILVNAGSMANIVGLTAARNAMAGVDLHQQSVADIAAPLRFYASDQVHNCHMKAMNLLGLGAKALVRVPTDDAFQMDMDALRKAIQADREAGLRPACVIATAGTTNTSSIDPVPEIADLCGEEGLWLHVDGCIGAMFAIAPESRHLVAGIDRADSLALDLHKGLQAPFDVGCALVRDRRIHRATFAEDAEYLQVATRGLAAAEFLHDYGPETSRGFRALKVWMMLRQFGVETFGRMLDQTVAQARHLTSLVEKEPQLALMAPTVAAVVCFRHEPDGLDEAGLRAHNTEIMLRLQETGIAVISDTTLRGRHCLRVAICNHRTRSEDLDLLVAEVLRIGADLLQPA
ncbi:pyridoxal phosphate-dependent decarboxylase family protein [Flavimaricola marinus]|uniref:L-2,4-diaminobutyrate decarboxylase n=1 Tax=Flavimaricola marinus TaxID=1819565 RepID=A0A238LC17_9RHOB|nr:pyridoxal-dependent decarboxylase [Flavimaricola marinus]SMY06955.1 L-2,4-diaminobutyrate decarboxylase [Flavimaricola marinus]